MKFCSKCGQQLRDEAVICVHCGCEIEERKQTQNKVTEFDEVSVGLCALSALFPIFGLIYWPLKHKETPKKAQACGIAAIISWAVSILIMIASL